MDNSNQIIIKRVKKGGGDGHHGGAWKVAYADFVTAMMAFFLLMWLLNATTEDQRKGIADYFNPTIPISPVSGGGSDLLNGETVFSEETLVETNTGGSKKHKKETKSYELETASKQEPEAATLDGKPLADVEENLMDQIDAQSTEGLANHIQMHVTSEGLVIELVDTKSNPLFEVGSTTASKTMELLLEVVAASLSNIENEISIVGHTDGLSYSRGRDYSNWELSTDRANVARRLMSRAGFPKSNINEVAGKADKEPLVEDRFAPQNRRISITILSTSD